MASGDPFDLQRFVQAQNPVYDRVKSELWNGQKATHWMWFMFPQLAGLSMSTMGRNFAISGHDEAKAYIDHPILGARLRELSGILLQVAGRSAREIFGTVDELKLRSCMSLFAHFAPDDLFDQVLAKYFPEASAE